MKNRIKINGIAIILALLLAAFFPRLFIRHSAGSIDDFVEIAGLSLILFGQLLRTSARGYKAEHSQSSKKLVTGGPYSLVRNPMYLGTFIIGLGIVLFIGNVWALAMFIIGFAFRYLYLFRKEESLLGAVFGKAYHEYAGRVPRIIPNFSSLARRDLREFLPLRLGWYRGELISIIPVLAAAFAVEFWEEAGMRTPWRLVLHGANFLAVLAVFSVVITALRNEKNRTDSNGCRKR